MSKPEEPLINRADFNSIQLKINLTNTTTQAEIREGKRSYGTGLNKKDEASTPDKNLNIIISEFLEDGLILEIPSKTCAANHNILIEIISENANPKIHFSGTMKIKSHEKLDIETDLIEASFLQKDEREWKKIKKIYNQRQEEIRNFINTVKGYSAT